MPDLKPVEEVLAAAAVGKPGVRFVVGPQEGYLVPVHNIPRESVEQQRQRLSTKYFGHPNAPLDLIGEAVRLHLLAHHGVKGVEAHLERLNEKAAQNA